MSEPHAAPPPPAKSETHSGLAIAVICVIAALGLTWAVVHHHKKSPAPAPAAGGGRGGGGGGGLPPVPVVLGKVAQKNVPIYLDGLGTVQAFNTVTVRARVDGQLQKVAFVEGQDVTTNDLLAQIDPAPFRTALEQAVGKKAQDAAQLANAKRDLERETQLLAAKIDSQSVYDTAKSLADQFAASVQADQAAIDSAQVQLDYCTIKAPVNGRTGIRQVDQGNIVHASDTNGLVVITQLKPISVLFTLPEQFLGEIHRQTTKDDFTVFAVDRDNTTILDKGTLAVIDNQIDTTTSTIRLKATFPNDKLLLWPGQFVNVRLLLTTRTNGLVVPASVVQRGPEGPLAAYAFVVEGDKTNLTVKQQAVNVVQIEGGEALVDKGLELGQSVVVDGQYKLQNGSKIRPAQTGNAAGGGSRGLVEATKE